MAFVARDKSAPEPSSNFFFGPGKRAFEDLSLKVAAEARPVGMESLDDLGDLQLLVGATGDQVRFTVCSRALSRASSVFKSMLNGLWLEKRPAEGDWTVRLPEDSPQPFRTLLSIIHCRFRDVPDTMGLAALHQVCVCADKYDILEPLGPWATGWCLAAERQGQRTTKDNALMAWIAWVLGKRELFEKSTKFLLWNSSSLAPRRGGVTAPRESHLVHLDLIGVIDSVENVRLSTVRSLVARVHEFWNRLAMETQSTSRCKYMPPSFNPATHTLAERKICGAAIFGSVTSALYRASLLPPSPGPFGFDAIVLQDLKTKVDKIDKEILCYESTHSNVYQSRSEHNDCNPGPDFVQAVAKAIDSMPAIVTKANYKHLKERAQKIGVKC